MSGEFAAVLEHYLAKMRAREPMAMYRFGDGEMMLVDGEAVGEHTQAARVDRWSAPARLTQLGRDLLTVLTVQEPWAHFGIPCPCCNEAGYRRLNTLQDKSPKFPANLFINANYPRFRRFVTEELDGGPVALVHNERTTTPWRYTAMTVPDDVVTYYEAGRSGILGQARAFARSLKPRSLVLVSAGPLSEVLIFTMWNEVPNHCYVDVGSALDEWTHGTKTRPYMEPGNVYATKECPLPAATVPGLPSLQLLPPPIGYQLPGGDVGEAVRLAGGVWGFGGWSLSVDALAAVCQHMPKVDQPTRILELGGGQSTMFFAALSATRDLLVTTVEHSESYTAHVRRGVAAVRPGSNVVRVIHSRLKQLNDGEVEATFLAPDAALGVWEARGHVMPVECDNDWTAHNAFYADAHLLGLQDETIDVLVVDGPHGNGRSLAYPLFRRALKKDALILIDDFDHYPFLVDLGRVMPYEEICRSVGDKHWVLVRRKAT